jgi:ribulose 1,5-bisphosphate synthetase/thiazole synthase
MKTVFKLGVLGGAVSGTYSVYTNYIRTPPPNPQLHEKENKKIVVVGGGIVGLSTAYYLSQYEDNDIVLLEKHMKVA